MRGVGVYEGGCIGFGDKNDQRGGWKLRLIMEGREREIMGVVRVEWVR